MPPGLEHVDKPVVYFVLVQRKLEYVGSKQTFKLFGQKCRCDPELAFTVKKAVGHQYMTMGIETEEVAERLDGNCRTRNSFAFVTDKRVKLLQGVTRATAESGQKFSIIQKISA
jgi:hypothetical protein